MAVVDVKWGWTGVEAGGTGDAYYRVRVGTVLCDAADSFDTVTAALPAAGDSHPDNANFKAEAPTVRMKAPNFFEVSIRYVSSGRAVFPQDEDPLAEPADISWDDAERTVAYDTDLDGTPIANTLGEPFDPPPTREISDPVLIIERSQAAFDPDDKLTYQDTICSETFYGAAIGRSKMGKIKARLVHAETDYWRARYEIQFRMRTPTGVVAAKAWWKQLLNQGVKYKDAGGNIQLSPNGEIVLLAADGKKTTPASPHWLYFREYPDQSWAALGLTA